MSFLFKMASDRPFDGRITERKMRYSPQLQEKIYQDADSYFIDLIRDIHNTRNSVDLETYIFHYDEVGDKVIAALAEASARGVKVRLLIDGVGLPLLSNSLLKRLEQTRVRFRLYHPIPWFFWHWKYALEDHPLLFKVYRFLLGLNHRNHRKVCIIDHQIAWIGSFNISSVHLAKAQGGEGWRDTAVRFQNVDTAPLAQAFNLAWEQNIIKRFIHPRYRNKPLFRLNYTRRQRRRLLKDLLRKIAHCKRRVWITNAYFVPGKRLLKALNQAALRGIDVRIILPSRSDIFFMPWTSSIFYRNLLKRGVKIYEYLPGILHAKTLVVDDWMTVGSSNLNYRSLLHDLEIDAVINHGESKQILERQFLEDMRQSAEISLKKYPRRPLWQRLFAHLALYAQYLL